MGSAENLQENKQEKKPLWKNPKALVAAALSVGSLAFALYENYDRSGEITSYNPIRKGPVLIDKRLNVLSWNMHNETSEKLDKIKGIIDKHDVDAAMLQEVSAKDAKGLHGYFPQAYIKFAMADAKTKPLEGGYGNVLMTFQEQKEVEAISIKGNSTPDAAIQVAGGLVADASKLDPTFERTKSGTQEDRSAMASTIQVQKEDSLINVRLITGHIGAPQDEIHKNQFSDLRGFLKDNSEEGAIFCGDVNLGPKEVIPSYLRIGFYAHQTKRTTLNGLNTDYCAYHPGDTFGEGDVKVLGNRTDHYALLGSWKTTP